MFLESESIIFNMLIAQRYPTEKDPSDPDRLGPLPHKWRANDAGFYFDGVIRQNLNLLLILDLLSLKLKRRAYQQRTVVRKPTP